MNDRWLVGTTSPSLVVVSEREAMKDALAIALLGFLSLCLAAGQQRSAANSVEDQIKKLEQDWAQAVVVKEGAASVDQYEADDIITSDPSGRVTGKA
jgi:hypothetical protein